MARVVSVPQSWSSAIVASAALVSVLSLASRILGLLRDRMLATAFGAGPVLDAYYAAFRIPDFLFNLLGLGALSAAFIPVYLRLRGGDRDRAFVFANRACSDILLVLLGICGIGAIAARPLFAIIASGFPPEQLALTVAMGRTLFLATFFLGASTIAGGMLQAEKRFFVFAAAPILYNLGIIIGVRWFVPSLGPIGIAWGVVLGAALHLTAQSIAARNMGFRLRWMPSLRDPAVREAAVLLVPRMIGLATEQLQLVVLAGIASTLAAGSLTAFTFATNIQAVPVSLIGIAFAVAAFPYLSETAAAHRRAEFRQHVSTVIRQVLLLAFPVVVLVMTLKAQIVRVLLGSGAFDWKDTITTFQALEAFGFGLAFAMLLPLLTRAFYALEDTRTPFRIGVCANILGIGAAWFVGRHAGPRGLAAVVAFANIVQATILLVMLRVRVGDLDGRRVATSMAKFATAASAMAIVIQVMKPIVAAWTGTTTFLGIAMQGGIAGGLGCVVYLVVGYCIGAEEIVTFTRALHRRVLRMVPFPSGGADETRG